MQKKGQGIFNRLTGVLKSPLAQTNGMEYIENDSLIQIQRH